MIVHVRYIRINALYIFNYSFDIWSITLDTNVFPGKEGIAPEKQQTLTEEEEYIYLRGKFPRNKTKKCKIHYLLLVTYSEKDICKMCEEQEYDL